MIGSADSALASLLAQKSAEREGGSPRHTLQAALARVRQRTAVDLSNARARAGFARGHLLDVAVFVPGGRGPADEPAAREFVELLVGGALFRDWIGEVRCAATPRGVLRVLDNKSDERTFPISELAVAIDAAVRGLHEGLPELPWHAVTTEPESVIFELEVERAPDYAAQDDVALVSTCLPEMLHCFLRGAPFSSVRFSRHGELFCYVKYESLTRDLARAVAERDGVERDLDRALIEARAGRVIGRGIGLAYAYLDLALSNASRAWPLLEQIGGERLPARSWLLFCDSDLEDAWLGLRSDSPEPPAVTEPKSSY